MNFRVDDTPKTETRWQIRFVAGAMRGRAIALLPGRRRLGASADCDVVLSPSDAAPHHVDLDVGRLALALQRAEGVVVKVNGRVLDGERCSLVSGDRLTIGSQELEIEKEFRLQDAADAMLKPDDTADALAAEAPAGSADGPLAWKPWLLSVTLLALLALGGFGWLTARAPTPEERRQAAQDSIQKAVAAYPEVHLSGSAPGPIVVEGFVPSSARRQELDGQLRALGADVVNRVHVVDTMLSESRRFISDPAVEVSYDGDGRLRVSGRVARGEVRERVSRLTQGLQPDVQVVDDITYLAAAPASGWAQWRALLNSPVVSVAQVGDGPRYIQLASGQRLYDGALLKTGETLRIPDDYAVVFGTKAAP